MAAVNMPQRRDPLESVVRGLQVAQSVFGIATDWKKLQQMKSAEDEQAQKKENVAGGVINQAQAAEYVGSGKFDQAEPGTKGAIEFTVDRNGVRTPLALIPRKEVKTAPLAKYHTVTTDEGVFAVNETNPNDMKRIGGRPVSPESVAAANPLKSAEEKKRFDGIVMGYKAVDDMTNALAEGANTFSVVGDNDFTFARTRWEEAIGRLQSGGAINNDEAARFRKLAPTWTDSPEMQAKKLNTIKSEMISRAGTMGFDESKLLSAIQSGQSKKTVSTKPGGAGSAIAAPAENQVKDDMKQKAIQELARRGIKVQP